MAARTLLAALTLNGAAHAAHLAAALPEADILVAERFAAQCVAHGAGHGVDLAGRVTPYAGPLRARMAGIFADYDRLVIFLALGAVIRLIAPHLRDKRTDPAVVAVDDGARFAIAALSGHVGGANAFAEQVAAALGATPVITTASDVAGSIAVDILGRELGWRVEADRETLTRAAACVVNREPVAFVQEAGARDWPRPDPWPANIRRFDRLEAVDPVGFGAVLWVSRRAIPDAWRARFSGELVVYRPPEALENPGEPGESGEPEKSGLPGEPGEQGLPGEPGEQGQPGEREAGR